MDKVFNVDEYIGKAPEEYRGKLDQLRGLIKKCAPNALEKISYGMPYYHYQGRLAYFAYFKNHIGLYIPPPIIENHKEELVNYKISVSAIHFPLDNELPDKLIKKLIKARMKWNEKLK
jgi:uncharacterized protein YdhG (YjbR/CyaY superfamily)